LSRTSRNCHARNLKSLSVHHNKITKILAPSRANPLKSKSFSFKARPCCYLRYFTYLIGNTSRRFHMCILTEFFYSAFTFYREMSCCGVFGTFCVFFVLVQFCCSFLRWIYRDVIGPQFGKPLKFKSYGKWACKL
jgi:hypothetical protein